MKNLTKSGILGCYSKLKSVCFILFLILESYLSNRSFEIKYLDISHTDKIILSLEVYKEVFLLCTADLPENELTYITSFADDTAILSVHNDPVQATITQIYNRV